MRMSDRAIHSVGLGGDGDEVAAIQDVEDAFGISLDYRDAPNWLTAGDVFASVKGQLSPEVAAEPDMWVRFSKILTQQSGIDPASIEPDSPLLLPHSRLWARVADVSAIVWGCAAFVLIGCIVIALISERM